MAALASMTGFARSEGAVGGLTWAWELRSVNGRGLELRFRLPPGMDGLEPAFREQAGRLLKRGNVTANLTVKREDQTRIAADPAALAQILALAQDLHERMPGSPPPRAEALLALPGVLRQSAPEQTEEQQAAGFAAVQTGFTQALDQLVSSRRAEGARLGATLDGQISEITSLCTTAAAQAADQPAAQRARMMENLQALLREAGPMSSGLPEDRIAQEVALLAQRSDVREELDRLDAHIHAAHGLLAEAEPIGRRLDFLVQEFNREINTLCSKSASVALTATGLKLKATIEQLREQVQNIE